MMQVQKATAATNNVPKKKTAIKIPKKTSTPKNKVVLNTCIPINIVDS
jgi:hypothetical protein